MHEIEQININSAELSIVGEYPRVSQTWVCEGMPRSDKSLYKKSFWMKTLDKRLWVDKMQILIINNNNT